MLDQFLHSKSVTKPLSCIEVLNEITCKHEMIMHRLKWAVKSSLSVFKAWFQFGRNCHKHIKITDVMEI